MNDMEYSAHVPLRARDVYLELSEIEERGERMHPRRSVLIAVLGLARRAFARARAAAA